MILYLNFIVKNILFFVVIIDSICNFMCCEVGMQGKFVILRDRVKIVSYIVNNYIVQE